MTNLAADARAKAQANWPGASVNARGRNWIRHEHPTDPERFILDSHIGPIHYGVSDDQEIDTAWIADTTDGFTHAITANSFVTRVRADQFNAGDIFRFEKDGESLVFDPQSINWIDENTSHQQIAIKQNVVGAFSDDTVSFPEAYGPGRHFQYINGSGGLQKLITIDAATDLPAVTLQGNDIWFEAEFSMSLSSGINFWIDGIEWARLNNVRVQTASMIEVRDSATGTNVLWWIGAARAWDSSTEISETAGQLEVRRQGGPSSIFITVRIPKTWIDAATFPIYIDPTIDDQVEAGADDTYAQTGNSSINTSSNTIKIGNHSVGAIGVRQSHARFVNISGLSGATIDTSYSEVYLNGGAPDVLCNIYADDSAAPTNPTTYAEFIGKTLTTAFVAWDGETSSGEDTPTPSLNSVIQELADDYDPSSIALYFMDDGTLSTGDPNYDIRSYEWTGNVSGPKLHIEYTAAGGVTIPVMMHHYRQQGMSY